jgi:hypothetical protein
MFEQDFILGEVVLNIAMPWGSIILKFATHLLCWHKFPSSSHQCACDSQKKQAFWRCVKQLTLLLSSQTHSYDSMISVICHIYIGFWMSFLFIQL